MSVLMTGPRETKRLVADRFRRIWFIVEEIAANPGQSRRELAEKFFLSERQIQADLNIMRHDMRMPLVRRYGYRFVGEGPQGGGGSPDLREAQLLVMMLRQAQRDRSIPKALLDALAAKLPGMFPVHLAPVVERTLAAVMAPPSGKQEQVFAALASALLTGTAVKLHYPTGDFSAPLAEPIVRPELLLPYLSSWYVVGHVRQRNRTMMLRLDNVAAATLAAEVGS